MPPYAYNKRCHCPRCRTQGLMGPAILVTVGMLLLLDHNNWLYWHQTWPVILLVIGAVIMLSRTAPANGHVPPGWAAPAIQPQYPPQGWSGPTAAPPLPQATAATSSQQSAQQSAQQPAQNDQQVKP